MNPKCNRRGFLSKLAGTACVAGLSGGSWFLASSGVQGDRQGLRPPGALDEADFLATCIRCGRCADACPNCAIVPFTEEAGAEMSVAPGPGERGTPVIFARKKSCILCSGASGDSLLCTVACPSGALQPIKKEAIAIQENVAMGTAKVDKNICYSYNGASCGACVRSCPFEGTALRAELWEKPVVDSASCVGCGLCERACIHYPAAIRVRPRSV